MGDVIKFLHNEWRDMMSNCSIGDKVSGEYGYFNTKNTKISWSPCKIDQATAQKEVNSQALKIPSDAFLPSDVHVWSYVKDSVRVTDSSVTYSSSLAVLAMSLYVLL